MPDIGKPPRAYTVTLGDSSHYPVPTIDWKGRVTSYQLFPIGSGGGGLVWGGVFNPASTYAANTLVIMPDGSLYVTTVGATPADDPPDFNNAAASTIDGSSFGIEPIGWLADGVFQDLNIDLGTEPRFYASEPAFSGDPSYVPCVCWGLNLTTGGTITLAWDASTGTAFDFWFILQFSGHSETYSGVVGSWPGSVVYSGLAAGVYPLVVYRRAYPGAAFAKIKATASLGAVIGAARVNKWQLIQRSEQLPTDVLSGTTTQHLFGAKQFTGVSGAITVDWSAANVQEFLLTGSATSITFSSGTFTFSQELPIILRFVQNGGGSMAANFWTATGSPIKDTNRLPTALGANNGDEIVVYFDVDANASRYVPIAWTNTVGDTSIQAPTTGFTITIGDDIKRLILNPAGTLATGTIKFPATPKDGQVVYISSTQTITALTLSGNGNTVKNAVTTLTSGPLNAVAYYFDLATTTWYPTE